jgi:hypothetical protein
MLRKRGLLLVSVFLLGLLLAPVSRAQDDQDGQDFIQDELSEVVSNARIVRLSHIEGTVQIDTENGFENATVNMPISEGDRLVARSDAWAEIQFEDGSTARLSPDTQITFAQLGLNADGGTVTAIDLDQGEAEFKIQKHEHTDFAVTARNKAIVLKHSGRFRVSTTNSTPLEVVVWKGEVSVGDSATGSHVAVKNNEDFRLNPYDFDQYDLEKGAVADDLDNWSRQRDEDLSTYAEAGTGNYTQSPYQYGASDLNYYGTYYDIAGYGYLWQPNGVTIGWNPYINGYWIWSPVYGYTWVSAYPWGWMPYRYGRWIWVNGYGWMWQPGYWHGWRPRPRLWNTPPGFHPPAPPATRMVFTRPGTTKPGGVRPGTVRPGTGVRPGTVQPRPGESGDRPVEADGGLQIPRIDVHRDQRGHRVFTNEEITDRVPRKDTNAAPGGAVRMERRNEPAPPAVRTTESPARPDVAPTRPAVGPPREARPGNVDRGEVRPSEVPRRTVEPPSAPVMRERPAPVEVPRQQPVQPAPRTEAPRAPVIHERPAPASVPRQQPAPPPRVAPPSPPPSAPRSVSPPPRPASPPPRETNHGSRSSEGRSERPK